MASTSQHSPLLEHSNDGAESLGSDSDFEEDIEMLNMSDLQDIPITPNPIRNKFAAVSGVALDQVDDDSEEEDGEEPGSRALLGTPMHSRTRPRPRERGTRKGKWAQARSLIIEAGPSLALTTVSLLLSGELLDHVTKWLPFTTLSELLIIIPIILNLNGNLLLNLTARLGTSANTGELDDPVVMKEAVLGNLGLLQVQAGVVSLVAAAVAEALGHLLPAGAIVKATPQATGSSGTDIPTSSSTLRVRANTQPALLSPWPRRPRPILPPTLRIGGFTEFVMVSASSMLAVCLSNIILGSFMCGMIIICRRWGRDPDNIAPPLASTFGDLLTLTLLGLISSLLLPTISSPLPLILTILLILSTLFALYLTLKNSLVRPLLSLKGWIPLFGAMIISSLTGIVLDTFGKRWDGFPLLAVVISGMAGSVGSIFVSRLSTALHAASLLPGGGHEGSGGEGDRVVMITLLVLTIPLEICFLLVLRAFGWLELPLLLAVFSVVFFCIAVGISLFLGRALTKILWNRNLDPDVYALPIHSALMDLVGQLLLVSAFELVAALGGSVRSETS